VRLWIEAGCVRNGELNRLGLYGPQDEEVTGEHYITRNFIIFRLRLITGPAAQLIKQRKMKREVCIAQSWEAIKNIEECFLDLV
jgi:hypothetical protein